LPRITWQGIHRKERCLIDATKSRSFSAVGIGLIVVLGLILGGMFVLRELGGAPSTAVFGSPGFGSSGGGTVNEVANQFLSDLKDGRVEAAYRLTGSTFQQRQSLAQFQAMMQKHPFPRPPGSAMATNKEDTGRGVFVYEYRFSGSNGQIAFTFEIGKDNEAYRVVGFTMYQNPGG
jgi:hypothetical protein